MLKTSSRHAVIPSVKISPRAIYVLIDREFYNLSHLEYSSTQTEWLKTNFEHDYSKSSRICFGHTLEKDLAIIERWVNFYDQKNNMITKQELGRQIKHDQHVDVFVEFINKENLVKIIEMRIPAKTSELRKSETPKHYRSDNSSLLHYSPSQFHNAIHQH